MCVEMSFFTYRFIKIQKKVTLPVFTVQVREDFFNFLNQRIFYVF